MAGNRRLIDANVLRTQFDDIPPFIGMTGGCVQQYIDKAPTVDAVEVVHGHWSQKDIISKKAGYGVRYYYHAECEVSPCRLFECAHDYCPNCGAKMDGDGNA